MIGTDAAYLDACTIMCVSVCVRSRSKGMCQLVDMTTATASPS